MMDEPIGHEFIGKSGETVAPSQRLHLILFGVNDVAKSAKFYQSLGWKNHPLDTMHL